MPSTIYPYKFRLMIGALLLMMLISTAGYSPAVASSSEIPVEAPERQIAAGEAMTNQIIVKYRATANATESNGQL